MVAREGLAVMLMLTLACPVWSGPGVVGTATAGRSATIRGNALIPGSTVFDGDTIAAGAGGNAWISLTGGGALHLGAESQVRLSRTEERIAFELTRGGAAFRTGGVPVQAHLADATIRPADEGTTVGVVAILSPQAAIIAAERGELLVNTRHDGKSLTLRPGEAVKVTLAPAPQAGGNAVSGRWVAILGVIVVGVVTAVAIYLNDQDRGLTFTQKRNAVSPFRFP